MKMRSLLYLGLSGLTSTVLAADLNVSGFGSIVGAKVVNGDGYMADYPNLGSYDDEWDVGQESRLGIQINSALDDKTNLTMQVMSRANNEYQPSVEWLFIKHSLLDDLDIQAGKLRLPVYYFSEYMDVGYAYPWVRIPSDTYSLDVTSFNGLKVNYRTYIGDLNMTASVFAGRQNNMHSELMSYLFNADISRDFRHLQGIALDFSWNDTLLRTTYTEADMVETAGVTVSDAIKISFTDVYLQQSFGNLTMMLEYNKYDPYYESYFASVNYRMGNETYYLMWSKFDLDLPFEEHDTSSLGVRHEVSAKTAVKFDVSYFNDEGFNPFTNQPNPVYHADNDSNGDATIVSIGFDFIF